MASYAPTGQRALPLPWASNAPPPRSPAAPPTESRHPRYSPRTVPVGTAHDRHAGVERGPARPVQAPRHCERSSHTVRRDGPALLRPRASGPRDRSGRTPAPELRRSGDKAPMQLLCTSVAVCDGLVRVSTRTEKVLERLHGVGSTGQEVPALQGLHGGSPLAEVVPVITPFFQSGDAPSRAPPRRQGRAEQTTAMFIHQ
jgi:hypothetical protein